MNKYGVPYQLSKTSIATLNGVHPRLGEVVGAAIKLTTVDFRVGEGVRTLATQRRYVAAGKSQTLYSMHMVQADGHGHAVDLWALTGGVVSWDIEAYYPIAAAMAQASHALGVPVRWGGAWVRLDQIPPRLETIKAAVAAYVAGRRKLGKSAFIDAVHFEVPL